MAKTSKSKDLTLVDANQTMGILKCSRGQVERLQLRGILTPEPTIYPMYYFKKSQVMEYLKTLKN